MTVKYLILLGPLDTIFAYGLPRDFNPASNLVECYSAGGAGGGAYFAGVQDPVSGTFVYQSVINGAGGGGAYSASANVNWLAGSTIYASIGSSPSASADAGSAGHETWANSVSFVPPTSTSTGCMACGGGSPFGNRSGGPGGNSAIGIGTTKLSGGAGGLGAQLTESRSINDVIFAEGLASQLATYNSMGGGGGGGGGCAGPNGAGAGGGNGFGNTATNINAGIGSSGSGGGSNGGSAGANNANGGNGFIGIGGGIFPGGHAISRSGGGGAAGLTSAGGAGANQGGLYIDATSTGIGIGPSGGSGGSCNSDDVSLPAGLGGGGGSGGTDGKNNWSGGGTGGNGFIVISYTPAALIGAKISQAGLI